MPRARGMAAYVRDGYGTWNGRYQEWLFSTTPNRQGVAAFVFATVSGCDQLLVGPINVRGGTLDLLMTDVLDLVRVTVALPIGNSDHSFLSAVISMAQAVPHLCDGFPLVFQSFPETSSQLEYSLWCNTGSALV